jgi:hypothetical protein
VIALLAALLFLIAFGIDVFDAPDGQLLGLGMLGWIAAGLVLLALHVGGMAWLDGRRRRGLQ